MTAVQVRAAGLCAWLLQLPGGSGGSAADVPAGTSTSPGTGDVHPPATRDTHPAGTRDAHPTGTRPPGAGGVHRLAAHLAARRDARARW